jgi:hypothetical protein
LIAIVIAMAIDHRPSNLDFPKEEVVIFERGGGVSSVVASQSQYQ